MRPRILSRYVAREVVQYTLLGLAAISVILLARNLVRVLDELLGAGFSWTDLGTLVRLLGTMLLLYALPVSFLFGVLLAVGRMAGDVEIVAMRACGIGIRQLLVPVLVLGVLISAGTLQLAMHVEPAARRELRAAVGSLVARGAGLQPGRFRRFGEVLVYVDARGGDQLQGIVVSDRRDPERPLIVFAKQGQMRLDPTGTLLELALEHGDIHLDAPEGATEERDVRISFDRFDYTVDLQALLGGRKAMRAKEMTWDHLRFMVKRIASGEPLEHIQEDPIDYALDLHRRVAAPVAPALFGLVGLPIAMRRTRGARSLGALWCAALAFSYYGLQTFFSFLASEGWISAGVAMWLPNACFAAIGTVLLLRARRVGG
jgi:lipopolysaccharide export system permease protein